MKTQSIGKSSLRRARPVASLAYGSALSPEALQQYKIGRENGTPLESPNTTFPSAGFEALKINSSTNSPKGWPDAQQRYWWKLRLEGGSTNEDFAFEFDTVRGYPDKSDSDRYWFIIHGPNGVKMEGFSWEADRQKGFPDEEGHYWRYVQYTECGPIKEWMLEKDRNYLARLEYEKISSAPSAPHSTSSLASVADGFSFSKPFTLNAAKEVNIPEGLIPDSFCCPIMFEIMLNPVVAMDGYTYEHETILRALERSMFSPMTGEALPNATLIPNYNTRSMIRGFLDKHPECWQDVYKSPASSNDLLALSSGAVPLDLDKWSNILRTDPRLLTLPLKGVTLLEFLSSQSESIVKAYLPTLLKLLRPKDWQDLIRIHSAQDWLKLVVQTCERCAAPALAVDFFSALQIGLGIKINPIEMALYGAFLYALEQKYSGLFKLALSQIQNVNEIVDDKKNTLLHLTARQGQTEMVQCLLNRGANLNQRNAEGLKAEDSARRAGFEATANQIAMLKSAPVLECMGFFNQFEAPEKEMQEMKVAVSDSSGHSKKM